MTWTNAKLPRLCATAAIALVLVSTPVMIRAADDPDPNKALKDEKARLDAQAELVASRAALDRARIAALGLPSFEGTRTVNTGAGAIEASMLSTTAVRRAAQIISGNLVPAAAGAQRYAGKYILLAGNEALDFAQAGSILIQMDAIRTLFDQIPPPPPPRTRARTRARTRGQQGMLEMVLGPTAAIGAISAAAGLLRSNVEISALETDAISENMLVSAIATQLGDRAIIPSAMIGVVEPCPPSGPRPAACLENSPPPNWRDKSLIDRFNRLAELRTDAKTARDRIPAENQTPQEQSYIAAADRAIGRFDTFFTTVTTPDEHGAVPIAQAVRLDMLRRSAARVVRVFVAQHSGSLIKTTNLLTTLGADPLRVSGALVARYEVTDPLTGITHGGGILTCQTALVRLSNVQRWNWRSPAGPVTAQCQEQ
ncbi:MAG: hypothetical protein QOD42_3206 [Sphingomonadales bacterium]|jgi:hypothetical protein|nr:hypothetical protein [Sphingomonadales bacterium]